MTRILIDHGTLITVDPARRIIEDGAISILDSQIERVGPRHEVATGHFERIIDATGMAVLPGLIDVHAHAGHSLVKSLGADQGEGWNDACLAIYATGSTPEFWHADAALGGLERLRFGVTCGVSLLGGGNSIYRSDEPTYAEAHLGAITDLGTRCVLAIGPCPPPYPMRFARWEGNVARPLEVPLDAQLDTCRAVIQRWHGAADGRVRLAVVSPSVHPARLGRGDELAAYNEQAITARALSRECGVLFTQDGHHHGSVGHAGHELGLLGPDVLLSHATDLDDDEVALCARTGTRIAHNPSAIASIRGRCPVPELLDAGVTVGLGSDAAGPDRNGDMFRHMQQCMHYHRRHARDPGVLPPGKVLEMATIDAARALGLEASIGSLEPGKQADVILLDLRRAHLWPPDMPLYRVVYYANGNDVDTVMVGGRILMRGRVVESVDEAAILDAAHRESTLARERCGLTHLEQMPAGLWGTSHF